MLKKGVERRQVLRARPSIAKAVAEEFKLYQAELARHKAAA